MAQEKGEENPETIPAARALPDYSHVSAAELNEVEDLRNQMDQHTRSLKSLVDVDGSFLERTMYTLLATWNLRTLLYLGCADGAELGTWTRSTESSGRHRPRKTLHRIVSHLAVLHG